MKVLHKIDSGGFGVVEKVELSDGTVVARKRFAPSILEPDADPSVIDKFLQRFRREVEVQSSIQCDSICELLDWDLDADIPWFTMPFAERNLAIEIAKTKDEDHMPVEALADVLNGLEELHSRQLVHRDLKPQNVLLIDGIWKLSDFGLVLPLGEDVTLISSSGSSFGTLDYMAPEQRADFHSVDVTADIYAFGCILHDIFAASTRLPFQMHTAPGDVGAIIERCTENDPQRRFQSVGAVRAALFGLPSLLPNLAPSKLAEDWALDVGELRLANENDINSLIRFVKMDASHDDRQLIFRALNAQAFDHLATIAKACWKSLVSEYCDWIQSTQFQFEYCDVLADLLAHLFDLGDAEIRSEIVICLASLASKHNRWYAMRKVIQLCGPSLHDEVAARIRIDILASNKIEQFQQCADVLSIPYARFHAQIATAIDDIPS